MGLILLVLVGILAAWICGDVLCFIFGITLIVMGIVTLIKRNKFLPFLKPKGQKAFSVLCIVIGVIGLAVSFLMLPSILDILAESDDLNGFLGGFDKYAKYAKGYYMVSRFYARLTFFVLVLGVLAFTVWVWVKGIRTARKLKLIDDVEIYNKKLKSSVFLFFLGTAGIGVSIFAVQELINNIMYT